MQKLTEDERKYTRIAILFYDAFYQNMFNPGGEALKKAFTKLQGTDFERKKQRMKEMAVTGGCGPIMVEDVKVFEGIEKGEF